jgi:hypothetical protein
MAYTKTNWTDRSVEKPLTYTMQDNGDGTTTLVPAEGTIVQSGTAITASVMNKLETQYDEMVAYLNSSPTWTNLTLQNGTTAFSGRTPRYTKVGTEVIVEGEIVASGIGTIATLPVGFRPPALRSFKVSQNWSASNDGATIYVNTDGVVTLQVAANLSQSISLMNIRFYI